MIFLPKQDKIDEEDSYIEVYRGKSNKENQSHSLFETAINCLYFSFDTQLWGLASVNVSNVNTWMMG